MSPFIRALADGDRQDASDYIAQAHRAGDVPALAERRHRRESRRCKRVEEDQSGALVFKEIAAS